MKIKVENLEINYIQYGEGADIVLLHGWGQNIQMMQPLGNNFSDRFRITILDLPGFGESQEPEVAWNIDKYELFLEEFLLSSTNRFKMKMHQSLIYFIYGIWTCFKTEFKNNILLKATKSLTRT